MAKKKPRIVLYDNIYIPIKFVDEEDALDAYTTHMYEQNICDSCEYSHIRPSQECFECELGGYKGSFCTARAKYVNGREYMRIPIGDRANAEEKLGLDFDDFRISDKRTVFPFRTKVKFTGELRDYQKPVYDDWMEHGYGITKSAPRTGKTVMGIAGAVGLGQRTLILANQKDYLDGFLETIMGGPNNPPMTNLPALEKKLGRKLVGFAKTKEDFKKFEIALCTYQTFIQENSSKKRISWINRNFGTMILDEVHKANAEAFSRLLMQLRMKHQFGLSATPKRKDGKEFLVAQLLGPVTSETSVKALTPSLKVHVTPNVKSASKYNGPAGFTYCESFLSKHKGRNEMILKYILDDLKNGRSIALPLKRVEHVKEMTKMINDAYGSTIAAEFSGGVKAKLLRKQVVDDARSSKIRVVVGNRALIQTGINVPRWDTLYYVMPMSNEPNWEQESSRICTPASEKVPKKNPIIRMFVDPHIGITIGCFRKTLQFSRTLGHIFTPEAIAGIREANGIKPPKGGWVDDGMDFIEHDELLTVKKKNAKKQQYKDPNLGLGFGNM